MGGWLTDRLGWSGATRNAEADARLVALALVCSAVREGQEAITPDMQDAAVLELHRVTTLTLQPLGFEGAGDIVRAMAIVEEILANTNNDMASLLSTLTPQGVQVGFILLICVL